MEIQLEYTGHSCIYTSFVIAYVVNANYVHGKIQPLRKDLMAM